jgi:phenylalanyl-tRNA synthetase alpha chain
LLERLEELKTNALSDLECIEGAPELEAWRVRYLGKKSDLTGMLRGLAQLPLEERKTAGARANGIRGELEAAWQQRKESIQTAQLAATTAQEGFDISLPGRPYPAGARHPITQTIREILGIFTDMGFQINEGPEAEWDYYNFEALNIPEEHPSRDDMATFWVDIPNTKRPVVLRTHGTAISARTLESHSPPIRAIEPAWVYRYEATDATHLAAYHNIDGVVVDKNITMADLKGTLYEFARRFFGTDRKVRFRCDYFPFVEPGVEIAVECIICGGEGCRICSGSGWLEILGAGMTHPKVLERAGIDPNVYTSFAFGMGVERMPMLRYGIDDIRAFYGSDLRFLKQFK